MSDLISRSQLLKEIEKYKFGAISNDTEREYIKSTILDFINFQPTAYDIDKVVRQLNLESVGSSIQMSLGLLRAIEIVKQGGVSDDVCEWNGEQSRLVTFTRFTTDCGDNIDLQTNSELLKAFRYCPFCGKKIKVVE